MIRRLLAPVFFALAAGAWAVVLLFPAFADGPVVILWPHLGARVRLALSLSCLAGAAAIAWRLASGRRPAGDGVAPHRDPTDPPAPCGVQDFPPHQPPDPPPECGVQDFPPPTSPASITAAAPRPAASRSSSRCSARHIGSTFAINGSIHSGYLNTLNRDRRQPAEG